MSEQQMSEFGIILTGREFGKDCSDKIQRKNPQAPYCLNFSGVISLGSSFGEEILAPLSKQISPHPVSVRGANAAVINCLEKIGKDLNISILFEKPNA